MSEENKAPEGAGGGDWRDAIPEDIREDPSLADIRDVGALAKGYVHAQRLVGRDRVPIPAPDAAPEEWDAVFSRLGRPGDPQGYELSALSDAPEWFQYDPEAEADFRKFAHAQGLNAKQAAALWEHQQRAHVNAGQAFQDAGQAEARRLDAENRREWGYAYDRNLRLAEQAAREFGGEDMANLVRRDPYLARTFAQVGRRVGEDNLAPEAGAGAVMTPAEAGKEIARIQGDPTHPYMDGKHPGHKQAVADMARLFNLAYPA